MTFKKRAEKETVSNYAFLKRTKLITKEDREGDPAWAELGQDYEDAKQEKSAWAVKAMLTVINSIIFQRRLVFIMTRESLRKLLKSDANWNKNIGLKQGNYKHILKIIYSMVGELVEYGKSKQTGRRVAIIKVTSKDILKYLNVNYEEQLEEARELLRGESTQSKLQKISVKEDKQAKILEELKTLYPEIDPHLMAIAYIKLKHKKAFDAIISKKKASAEMEYSDENQEEWSRLYDDAEEASKSQDRMMRNTCKYFLNNPEKYLQMHQEYCKMNERGAK
jgi:hypothetical protein